MEFGKLDPVKYIETVKDGVCKVQCGYLSPSTVANNQSIIAGVSGKRIRVIGWCALSTSSTVSGAFLFKSASGGTQLTGQMIAAGYDLGSANSWSPMEHLGFFETNTGEGLFTDVVGNAIHISVFYYTYTP